MPTTNQKRLSILDEIDTLLQNCNGCPKKRESTNYSIIDACGGCSTYNKLNQCGKQLDGLKNRQPLRKTREFSQAEDDLIINEIKKNGIYHGFYKYLSDELDRPKASIRSRVEVLTKRGVLN